MAKISKVYEVSDEEFKKIIAEADSYSDCLRALGLGTKGGSSTDILKRRIAELNCDISHFYSKSQIVAPNVKYTLDEILVENSDYNSITKLKNRLIKEHKLEYKCACCGLTTWLNKPITLQLHHINGQHNDHRLENLEFLCPNCHAQTDTYSGKNQSHIQKKVYYCPDCGAIVSEKGVRCLNCARYNSRKIKDRPSREELKLLLQQLPFVQIGAKYGVSDNAIRRWCKSYGLPSTAKEKQQITNWDEV